MQLADAIVTDYSACAFEASLLMKPLYFFVPDYDLYMRDRGLNVDLRQEMPAATFTDADALADSLRAAAYDYDALYAFQSKYVENTKNNNAAILANFVLTLLQRRTAILNGIHIFKQDLRTATQRHSRDLEGYRRPGHYSAGSGQPAPDAFPVDEVRAITADYFDKNAH